MLLTMRTFQLSPKNIVCVCVLSLYFYQLHIEMRDTHCEIDSACWLFYVYSGNVRVCVCVSVDDELFITSAIVGGIDNRASLRSSKTLELYLSVQNIYLTDLSVVASTRHEYEVSVIGKLLISFQTSSNHTRMIFVSGGISRNQRKLLHLSGRLRVFYAHLA